MYKNIYYDRFERKIHLWTDDGYEVFDSKPYFYFKSDVETDYQTIFGDYVEKIEYSPYESIRDVEQQYKGLIYESDVMTEVRTLVDRYHNDDSLPKTHNIYALDIEVSKSKSRGYARPPEIFNFITAITLTNLKTKEVHTLVLDPKDEYDGKHDFVETFFTEKALLKRFVNLWNKLKPSITTGWNSEKYDIPYLYLRIQQELDTKRANKLSPIDKIYVKEVDHDRDIYEPTVNIGGISHLDYMTLYKNYKMKNMPKYSLDYISNFELGVKKIEYEGDLHELWENDINKFIDYNVRDVDLIDKLEEKLGFLDLHMKMSHISHVPYEFALSSVRLIEGKFLTETKKRNLVCPNIPPQVEREVSKIVGAFVKQSKKGLFEYLFDLDLTSLYPMIMATLNLSTETKVGRIKNYIDVWMSDDEKVHYEINKKIFDDSLEEPDYDREIDINVEYFPNGETIHMTTIGQLYEFLEEENCTLSVNGILYSKDEIGEVPKVILELFGIRSVYKEKRIEADMEGDEDASKYYDLMQLAFKIFINSIYGVFCNEYFRLTDRENAQSITLTGQYTNKSAIDSVTKLHHLMYEEIKDDVKIKEDHLELFEDPIITGDTDSIIMSSVPSLYYKFGSDWLDWDEDRVMDEVIDISKLMAEVANERSEKFAQKWLNTDKNYLEFKEEWVARSGFYVGVKKRYANWIRRKEGATVDDVDIKGLDVIRSSFPKHLQDFLKKILYDILKFVDKDEIYDYIIDVRDDLIENSKDDIDVISFISSANNLGKYSDRTGRPIKGAPFHVKGALNFNRYVRSEGLENKQQTIFEGDKIRVLYLRNNPYNFDVFSFPISGMEDELEEFIKYYINSKKSIDSLLDNKLEKYYNAMDWNPPNTKYEDISDILIQL